MMQDESRELSRWLSTTPDARSHAKEAAEQILRGSDSGSNPEQSIASQGA